MSDLERLSANYQAVIGSFLQNDRDATEFICKMFSVLHAWDDLVDQDKAVFPEEASQVFWFALVDLPLNPFYQRYFAQLHPVLVNAILNWHAATKMEREGGEKQQQIAFILRGAYIDLLSMAAFLVGGHAWAAQAIPAIRLWAHKETFSEYLTNLQIEQEKRDV